MTFEPVLLARVNKPDSHRLEGYRTDGGYAAFERTLREKQPADVVNTVKDSGLRGRGGAGFPTGLKWTFLPKDHPGPVYLCVNADESEPCTYNNRILMEKDPHQVLEGIMLACYAIKCQTAYFYIRYEYGLAYRVLQAAIDELSGTAQFVKIKASEESDHILNLFGPVPLWAQRRLDIVGRPIDRRPGALFSYQIPSTEVDEETTFLKDMMWMDVETS